MGESLPLLSDPIVTFNNPSTIDIVNEEKLLLGEWLDKKDFSLELIYRLSEHGSKKSDFDSKVQG